MTLSTADPIINRLSAPFTALATIPIFSLKSEETEPQSFGSRYVGETSNFDDHIKKQFERTRRDKILRSDPLASDVLRRQIIPGKLGLLAEHEPSLFAKKRPAQVNVHVAMDTKFNHQKFNFNRVSDEETLLKIIDGNNNIHRILVNVSPLMYGHGLLIPHAHKCLPQQLTHDAIQLAINLLRKCIGQTFCIGFNSLGAFSSVNHQHLHILYPSELDHEARGAPLMNGRINFPISYAPIKRRVTDSYHDIDCTLDELDWMVPCFSLQAEDDSDLLQAVTKFVRYLHNKRIPHNVLFIQEPDDVATSIRCIVIPRQHQDHFDDAKWGFNAALGEISGMLIARTKEHFDAFKEHDIMEIMRCYVACKENVLDDICSELQRR